jgi:hypothetical protein
MRLAGASMVRDRMQRRSPGRIPKVCLSRRTLLADAGRCLARRSELVRKNSDVARTSALGNDRSRRIGPIACVSSRDQLPFCFAAGTDSAEVLTAIR